MIKCKNTGLHLQLCTYQLWGCKIAFLRKKWGKYGEASTITWDANWNNMRETQGTVNISQKMKQILIHGQGMKFMRQALSGLLL